MFSKCCRDVAPTIHRSKHPVEERADAESRSATLRRPRQDVMPIGSSVDADPTVNLERPPEFVAPAAAAATAAAVAALDHEVSTPSARYRPALLWLRQATRRP